MDEPLPYVVYLTALDEATATFGDDPTPPAHGVREQCGVPG
jgi:hypothetical protein